MNIALILSGGTGTRLGSEILKQYIKVCGKPVISYCIEILSAHEEIHAVHIVAESAWQEQIEFWMESDGLKQKFRGFSAPGATRQLSIWNGLQDIGQYAIASDCVLIHDAARPMLSEKLITDCLDKIQGHDGVIPVLPMKDTVYSSLDGRTITSLLDRSSVYAGQAPEVFRLGKYYEANQRLLPEKIWKISGSTEPAVAAGMEIAMISGEERNFKITTKEDLERFLTLNEAK